MERKVFTMRLSEAERDKLRKLAQVTGRAEGDVLRRLLAEARLAPRPDVTLSQGVQK